jgi:hypothetical protein
MKTSLLPDPPYVPGDRDDDAWHAANGTKDPSVEAFRLRIGELAMAMLEQEELSGSR